MIVYVAGPIRADSDIERKNFVLQAATVSYHLRKLGHTVLCPHEQSSFGADCMDTNGWIRHDLNFLSLCQACYICNGWENSQGTLLEINFCVERGIPIYRAYMDDGILIRNSFDPYRYEDLWQGKLDSWRKVMSQHD